MMVWWFRENSLSLAGSCVVILNVNLDQTISNGPIRRILGFGSAKGLATEAADHRRSTLFLQIALVADRQVNLRKSPVDQLCLYLIGCHCFARRVILNCDQVSLASIGIRARGT